jgi:uncharacterized membrane protein YciS (DUF1049 family)
MRNVAEQIQEAVLSTKVAAGVAAGTTTAGVAEINQWVPHNLGELSTAVGIVLASILIVVHSVTGIMNFRKVRLEIKALQQKERERLEIAKKRRESGEPTRRSCDFTD